MSKLKHVKIIVPVLSIGNVEGTIKALADIADYGSACCHIDSIEAEITVQPHFTDPPLSPEDQKTLDDQLAESHKVRQQAESISTEPPNKEKNLMPSTVSESIQAFAAANKAEQDATLAALENVVTGVRALDDIIVNFQNSPGTLSDADQKMLDDIVTASKAVRAQSEAISTTPPGTPIPVVPPPTVP